MNPSHNSDSARNQVRSEASYSPSVPVSVYRELAAELHATKAMVDSLSAQNNHLHQQNHVLRQNIHQMVQVALQLGHHAGVAHPAESEMTYSVPAADFPATPYAPVEPVAPQAMMQEPRVEDSVKPPRRVRKAEISKLVTEQSGENRRYSLESSASGSMSTLWLVVSIAIIILTAFGAGFLIMRPLISDR
ncbi:hypothetical protein [Leptothoe kymatousa]|uniref:Uncharacterized protein n=1 Tax=Leptothoe kymatousa TAU-MAC 1615 TaxID=2364775 RepID=A0ABS5Y2L4_9CYAN|nr:hypothetical protein [Leptothoe kymatousa]MBT9311230.1 hypothetical protein [Leptothoe kymatousa TAU-MAC 1615]